MEAIYLVEETGRLLLNHTAVEPAPAVGLFLPYLSQLDHNTGKHPALVEVSPSQLVYYHPHEQLVLIIPCETTIEPMLVQEVALRIIEVISTFIDGKLTPSAIESQSSTLSLVLGYMIECGRPGTMEPDILHGFVPTGTILDKILLSEGGRSTPWDYPWRRAKVQHTKQQLYVDVIERLHIVTGGSKRKRPALSGSAFYNSSNAFVATGAAICRVDGCIKLASYVSGNPQVQIDFQLPQSAQKPRLHPAVDREAWSQRGTLSLVPPDVTCEVCKYTMEIPQQGLVFAELLPLLGDAKDEFEIRISTNMDTQVKEIEHLSVSIVLQKDALGVKELRSTSGDLDQGATNRPKWSFGASTPVGWNATFRGQALGAQKGVECRPIYLEVDYSLIGRVPSGSQVRSISLLNLKDSGKPYKGLRYQTEVASFIVR